MSHTLFEMEDRKQSTKCNGDNFTTRARAV